MYIFLTIVDFLLIILTLGIYGEEQGRKSSCVIVVHEEKLAYAIGDYPAHIKQYTSEEAHD